MIPERTLSVGSVPCSPRRQGGSASLVVFFHIMKEHVTGIVSSAPSMDRGSRESEEG